MEIKRLIIDLHAIDQLLRDLLRFMPSADTFLTYNQKLGTANGGTTDSTRDLSVGRWLARASIPPAP